MKNFIKESLLSNNSIVPLALLICTIPLPIKFHSLAIVGYLLYAVFTYTVLKRPLLKPSLQILPLLILAQFFVQVLGTTHVASFDMALQDLERCVYPIVLIIIFHHAKQSDISYNDLVFPFMVSCMAIVVYGFIHVIIVNDFNTLFEIFKGRTDFRPHIYIQPLYLSIYLIFTIFFSLEFLRLQWASLGGTKRISLFVLIALGVAIVFLMRSKIALILLPLLLIFYIVIVLKKRGWLVAFSFLLVAMLTFLLDGGEFPLQMEGYGSTVSKAFEQRLSIWSGTVEGIKEAPFFGAGTGETQELINNGFRKIGFNQGIENEFNAHNQYLQFLARNGIIELLVFLTLLTYSFWVSAKSKNYTFLMFNILVAFAMLTESLLSVQKGIAFFYFLLFAFIYLPEKKDSQS